MRSRFVLACLAPLTLLSAAPVLADDAPVDVTELTARYRPEVQEALRRGRQMYLYDQAAWHATDQMLADFDNTPDKRMRGYFVEPGASEGTLSTVFYGEIDGKHVEFARYEVQLDKVVSSKVPAEGERPPLSLAEERLVTARTAAIQELIAKDYGFCNRETPNTIILPPGDDGIISVYLLTPPTENDSYPLGGHFRVDIGPDDKAVSSRRFLKSCFDIPFGKSRASEGEPAGFVVTHVLDPQPTEIHFFVSAYIPIDMMIVTTENNLIWGISKGRFATVTELDPSDKQ